MTGEQQQRERLQQNTQALQQQPQSQPQGQPQWQLQKQLLQQQLLQQQLLLQKQVQNQHPKQQQIEERGAASASSKRPREEGNRREDPADVTQQPSLSEVAESLAVSPGELSSSTTTRDNDNGSR